MLRNVSSPILIAAVTTVWALIWLTADVELTHAGHLNGLFYVGVNDKLPRGALTDSIPRVRDQHGFDGEFYYLIAHDPLNRRGFLAFLDTPRYRWRRIGLPGLAWLLALGNDDWVDRVYVALQLVFVFLGSYWLAGYAKQTHWSPGWGLAFLTIPAVAISLDRMTVDLPLAALAVALWYYVSHQRESAADPPWPAYAALAAAPLVRETGILLIVAWCAFWVLKKDLRNALWGAACAIPALGWWLYVATQTYPDITPFFGTVPFGGIVRWTAHALAAPEEAYGPRANAVLELAALAGIWLAFVLTIYVIMHGILDRRPLDKNAWDLPELTAVAFAGFASLFGYQDIWGSDYGIGRTLSPLLMALAAIALRDRRWVFACPLLLTAPRIALQFAAELRVALLAR